MGTRERKKGCSISRIIIAVVVALIIVCVGLLYLSFGGTPAKTTPEPTRARPTIPPTDPPPAGRTMYVCGYDRCRDSGEYSKLTFPTGINVWNNPDPDRGGVHHKVSNGDQVTVIEEKRVYEGPGGLWYKLQGGGWIDDLWLTEQPCNADNLPDYSFTDCLGGKY